MTQKQADKLFNKNLIYIDIFNTYIYVFFNEEDYNKMMNWRGQEDVSKFAIGVSYACPLPSNPYDIANVIGIFDFNIGIVAHESIHMAMTILDQVGYKINRKHDEMLPYLSEFIINKILELKKKND